MAVLKVNELDPEEEKLWKALLDYLYYQNIKAINSYWNSLSDEEQQGQLLNDEYMREWQKAVHLSGIHIASKVLAIENMQGDISEVFTLPQLSTYEWYLDRMEETIKLNAKAWEMGIKASPIANILQEIKRNV